MEALQEMKESLGSCWCASRMDAQCAPLHSGVVKDADELGASVQQPKGYLLFPLRSNRNKGIYAGRGVFEGRNLPRFELRLLWRGEHKILADIVALVGVWGHLGGIGFRQRRAMGAVAFTASAPEVGSCLDRFNHSSQLSIKALSATDANSAITTLANWLRGWRSHGRTIDHPRATAPNPPHNPGFDPFAKNDHDRGADLLNRKGQGSDQTFRPAIGLPIIQRFQSGETVNWEWNVQKKKSNGRFASPVLLRPHRDGQGNWHALVIFVDAHKWPEGKQVFLNGEPRGVSLDLYEAMKKDATLEAFP